MLNLVLVNLILLVITGGSFLIINILESDNGFSEVLESAVYSYSTPNEAVLTPKPMPKNLEILSPTLSVIEEKPSAKYTDYEPMPDKKRSKITKPKTSSKDKRGTTNTNYEPDFTPLGAPKKDIGTLSQTPSAGFQKGFTFTSWWNNDYFQSFSDTSLNYLDNTGTEYVSLLVTWYQDTTSSTTIYRDTSKTPSDAALIHAINDIHSRGMKVMLKPHVDVKDYSWRGDIVPSNWNTWFSSYADFINHYADLAEANGVEQFVVGTELKSTTSRTTDWQNIIAGVRSRFSGPLVYSANHDNYQNINFWSDLDYIGVNAYFALTAKTNPTLQELKDAWVSIKNSLSSFSSSRGKQIIFTEIGYQSIDGTNMHPWWSTGTTDLQEQEDCYRAVLETFWDEPWFEGIYFWHWYVKYYDDPDDFAAYNKPAEDVVKEFYIDSTPPSSITGLTFVSKSYDWIYWTWTNPTDVDFEENVVYINGINVANTANNYYNATGLAGDTAYTITVHTKDKYNNVNNTDVSDTQTTDVAPECFIDADCDDSLYCNGVETCQAGSCVNGTIVDCSSNDLAGISICTNDPDLNPFTYDFFAGFTSTCDEVNDECTSGTISLTHTCDITQCSAECEVNNDCDDLDPLTDDVCLADCSCEYTVIGQCIDNSDCDDGLYCNGIETCNSSNECVAGNLVDCSGNDLAEIATCTNDPDNNLFTWDFASSFTSTCDEVADACTTGAYSYTHTCDINNCGAECEVNADCDDGNTSTLDTCLGDCTCYNEYMGDCVVPYNGMNITTNTTLCPGTYYLPSGINIGPKSNVGVVVDCNNALIYGDGTGTGANLQWNYKTLMNCRIENYSTGVEINGRSNLFDSILADNAYGVRFATNDIIEGNTLIDCGYAFYGWHGDSNIFRDNVIINSSYGFYLHETDYNNFIGNNISGCLTGFHLWWYAWDNNFIDNVIENCGKGVYFDWHSGSNYFRGNKVRNNNYGFTHPAEWWGTIYHNEFYSNEIDNNTYGMYLANSEDMTIKDNIISNNEYAINMPYAANNLIYHNNFINNTNQEPTSSGTQWSYGGEGNYWNNYDEPSEGCNDVDLDLICDDPYGPIVQDYYPLTQKDGWLLRNHAPVLDFIPSITAKETDLITIIATAIDIDGDILNFSINDSRFEQTLNSFNWQTQAGDAGEYNVKVTVSDGELNDSQDVYITVTDANITCTLDSQCPGPSYSENYCGVDYDVYSNYTTYTCINPGTVNSECQAAITPRLISVCDYGCVNATCRTNDVTLMVSVSYKVVVNETSDAYASLHNNGGEDTNVTLLTYDMYSYRSNSPPFNVTATLVFEDVTYNITRNMVDSQRSKIVVNGDEFILFKGQIVELGGGIFLGYSNGGPIYIGRADVTSIQVNNLVVDEIRGMSLDWIPKIVGYHQLFIFANVTDDVFWLSNFHDRTEKVLYNSPEVDIDFFAPLNTPLSEPMDDILCAKNEGGQNATVRTVFYDMYDYEGARLYYNTTETIEFDNHTYSMTAYKLNDRSIQLFIDGEELIIFRNQILPFNDIFVGGLSLATSFADMYLGKANVSQLETINIPVGGGVCYLIDLTWIPTTLGYHQLYVYANVTGEAYEYNNYEKDYTNVYFDGECLIDSDCGTDGFLDNDYCNADDVWDTYRTYTCIDPGTSSATCTYTDQNQSKETCAETCSGGVCVGVECYDNSDCGTDDWVGSDYCNLDDVWNTWRTYVCSNPGTASASCSYSDNNQSKEVCTDACVDGACVSFECYNNSDCDDGLYCNGEEICDAGSCQAGTSIDCSSDDLDSIESCTNDPDNNSFTWDYFAGFTSTCDEATDSCTTGGVSLTHTCDISQCSAECEADSDCAQTECDHLDGCDGTTYVDYHDVDNDCVGCSCEQNDCTAYDEYTGDTRCILKPDLSIKSAEVLTPNPVKEEWVTLQVIIENLGDAAADDVYWVLDTDSAQPNPSYGPFSVEAGKTVDTYPAVKYMWPGGYSLMFTLDIDNLVDETDETNNEVILPLTVS